MRIERLLPLASCISLLAGCAAPPRDAWIERRTTPESFVEVGGHRIHVDRAGPDTDPILLLHGFGGSGHNFRLITPRLAARHRVVTPDLYGFGFTERPEDPSCYSPDAQQRLVLALMDRLGLRHVHLVGHSYGGTISLSLALAHPERVRTLTLISSPPRFGMPTPKPRAGERPPKPPRSTPLLKCGLHILLASPPAYRWLLRKTFHQTDLVTADLAEEYRRRFFARGYERALRGFTSPEALHPRRQPDSDPQADLRCPTLLLWGRHDAIVPLMAGEHLARRHPDARFVILDRSGHMPIEEEPDRVADLVLETVDRAADRR